MRAMLDRQRAAFLQARPEPLALRKDRIRRLIALLVDHGQALAEAMNADFGNRSITQSLLTDVMPGVSFARYCLKNLDRWARPERRRTMFPLGLLGGRSEVRHEPKGVIGIVAPWNFPVGLVVSPMAQAFAAGNRCMVKPSEFTPETSALMADLFARHFAPEEVGFCLGGADAGQRFCGLPFDHLLFTGATAIGRHVLHAAADHLVPVALELGGKSPVIVGRSADLALMGRRVALGKMLNAGQICLAPDYLLVPEELADAAIDSLTQAASAMYPALLGNDDYAAIINARHHQRLSALVDDACAKGARVVPVNPAGEDFTHANSAKLPLTILRDVTPAMRAMQEEVFGPVLPVMTYRTIDQAIAHVNAHDRPLGLYYFGRDAAEREAVLGRTLSGGVTVNDVIMHISMDDLPFGGIGASGMGSYHGPEGFRTFSHARAVYRQPRWNIARLAGLEPPYGAAARRMLSLHLRK